MTGDWPAIFSRSSLTSSVSWTTSTSVRSLMMSSRTSPAGSSWRDSQIAAMSSGGQTWARTSIPVCRFTSSSAKMFVGSLVATMQDVPLDPDRDDAAPLDEVQLQLLEDLLVHLLGGEAAELQPIEPGLRFQDIVGADDALFEKPRRRVHARFADRLPAQPAVLLIGDLPQFEQHVRQVPHVRAARRLGRVQITQAAHFLVVRIERGGRRLVRPRPVRPRGGPALLFLVR